MRTTIAVVADTHADERSRWDEHCRVMDWIREDIARRSCILTIHAGDIYEGVSTPRERGYVQAWCQGVCESSPLVIVGGNHEQEGDVAALGRLRTQHPIVATETPGVVDLAGVRVAMLPWPRKAALLAAIGRPVSTHDSDAMATEALRAQLRGFAGPLQAHQGPTVLAAHALVDGCMTDHDQPLCGAAMALGVVDLAMAGASCNVLGHIHAGARNHWARPVPTAYPGAPRHCNYGEAGPYKGYLLAHHDGARFVGFERVATPCRPMVLLRGRYQGGAIHFAPPAPEVIRGAEVRLRYTVVAAERAAASHEERTIRSMLMQMGAHAVKVEAETITVAVARAPEVARADSTDTALLARWDLRGEHRDGGERSRLLCKLSEAEEDVG